MIDVFIEEQLRLIMVVEQEGDRLSVERIHVPEPILGHLRTLPWDERMRPLAYWIDQYSMVP